MDGSPDGVSYAIPPVAGIGNFKGVMLCNRPEASSLFSTTAPPFRSAIAATHGPAWAESLQEARGRCEDPRSQCCASKAREVAPAAPEADRDGADAHGRGRGGESHRRE